MFSLRYLDETISYYTSEGHSNKVMLAYKAPVKLPTNDSELVEI
jgi:hypothetical protein